MRSKKTVGIIVILAGIALLAVSLLADFIGAGDVDPDHYTYGFKQIIGTIVGVMVILVGLFLTIKNL